ncbi:MAG: SBBP repeat-containing protein [Candidatus Firestonebacteria bacterium]
MTGIESVTGQGYNIWTRKYDSNGTVVWTETYNGTANGADYGQGIAVDSSGNVYVTGYEWVTGQGYNIWTRKYDSNGTEVWTKTYNGAANDYIGYGIAVDSSGNVYVIGSETVTGQGYNIWTRKYDSNGTEVWTKTYNGAVNGDDYYGTGVAVDSSGNVYVTGFENVAYHVGSVWTSWNIWTRKYDSSGNEVWTKTYNGAVNGDDVGNGIAVDSSGNVYVTGFESVAGQDWNIWTRKYGPQATTTIPSGTGYFKIIGGKDGYINTNNSEVANFVYKTTEAGTVTFKIYNLKGDLVKTVSASATGPTQLDSYNYDCKNEDGNSLSSGIYIVKAEGPGLALVKKMAVIR